MTNAPVTEERRGGVAIVRLDRPPVNALDLDTLNSLVAAVERAAASDASALVITGREGSFSGGVDLKAVMGYGPKEQRGMVMGINRLCEVVYSARMPTVAASSGHAVGGGLVLILCCDQRIGADRPSVYSLPEVRAGIPFPTGAWAVVRNELGPVGARRLALCDLRMNAQEALAAGVLDAVVPPDQLQDAAVAAAERLASLPEYAFQSVRAGLRAEALAVFKQPDPLAEAWL